MDITYNADGEKLCVSPMSYVLSSELLAAPLPHGESAELPQERADGGGIADPLMPPVLDLSTRYCGNVIFERGNLTRLLTDEGYVTFAANGTPTYHYYLRDHLGNVRVVFRQDGRVEQRNDYYPLGALMATSTNGSVQPYKYNGKELDRTDGLDLYDYGARWMDAKVGARFTTMDPLCEKYYNISPYAYCHDNPINRVDLDGRDDYYSMTGQYLGSDNKETDHIMISYFSYQIPFLSSYNQQIYQHYSLPIEDCKLSSITYSNIFTDIVSRDGEMDLSKIHNSRISVNRIVSQHNRVTSFTSNDASKSHLNAIASTKETEDGFIITAFVFQDNIRPEEQNIFTTVSNVVNVLVGHEYNGHVINDFSDNNRNHHVVFENQMKHHSWERTTREFKQYEREIYEKVKKREQ